MRILIAKCFVQVSEVGKASSDCEFVFCECLEIRLKYVDVSALALASVTKEDIRAWISDMTHRRLSCPRSLSVASRQYISGNLRW